MGLELDSSHLLVSETPQTATKKSKKKRKREKERDDGAAAAQLQNEPTINEQPRLDVKLELVNNQVDKTPPVVGYFPSGYNPHKTNDINDAQEPILPLAAPPSVKLYRNAQRAKVEKSSGEKNEKGRTSERLELVVSPN
jgi:DNA-directed RNA polymerase I subunit RPA49